MYSTRVHTSTWSWPRLFSGSSYSESGRLECLVMISVSKWAWWVQQMGNVPWLFGCFFSGHLEKIDSHIKQVRAERAESCFCLRAMRQIWFSLGFGYEKVTGRYTGNFHTPRIDTYTKRIQVEACGEAIRMIFIEGNQKQWWGNSYQERLGTGLLQRGFFVWSFKKVA